MYMYLTVYQIRLLPHDWGNNHLSTISGAAVEEHIETEFLEKETEEWGEATNTLIDGLVFCICVYIYIYLFIYVHI